MATSQKRRRHLDDSSAPASSVRNAMYLNVLDRTPSLNELGGWVDLIQGPSHFTREMILVGFAESRENITKAAVDWLIEF